MRTSDIVNALAIRLPALVDDFTVNSDVSSLTRSGTTVTVTTTTDHGLSVGDKINIVGARTPIAISSIVRTGLIASMVTATDHDFTETSGFENVEIEGAAEPEFNGTFKRLTVPNRRNITFQVEDSGPATASGSPLLINGENIFNTYNGIREVTATPTTTAFEYEVTNTTLFTPASGIIVAKTRPQISAAVTYGRILSSYTKQPTDKVWIFVVMGDGIAQKNRKITVDSTDNISRVHFFDQRITQVVSLYLFIPSITEIAGRQAADRAQELLLPICQSILFSKFDSLLSAGFCNPLQFNEHGFHDYNTAFYVHRYTFEQTLQMTVDDTIGPDDDVAFRDIFMTMGLDVGTETFTTDIDLDDDPFFDPVVLPGLVFWLDAQEASTITESSGLVSQWDDKSISGKDVVQGLELDQPLTGTDTINGVNVLKFDGNAFLQNTSFLDLSGTEYTVVMVGEYQGTDTSQTMLQASNGTGSRGFIFNYTTDGHRFISLTSNPPVLDFVDPLNTENILIGTLSASEGKFYVNGVLVDNQPSGGLLTSPVNQIDVGSSLGATSHLTGVLGEILIYDRVLSDAERISLESHLSDKWGIAVS